MNSLLNKQFLVMAALVWALQSTNSAPEIVELRKADGVLIVGIKQDATHFVTCKGSHVNIDAGDVIARTDRTCQDETNDPRCHLCAMSQDPRFDSHANKRPDEKAPEGAVTSHEMEDKSDNNALSRQNSSDAQNDQMSKKNTGNTTTPDKGKAKTKKKEAGKPNKEPGV